MKPKNNIKISKNIKPKGVDSVSNLNEINVARAILSKSKGATIQDIVNETQMPRPTIISVLDRMKSKEYIIATLQYKVSGQPAQHWFLSPKGIDILKKESTGFLKSIQIFLAALQPSPTPVPVPMPVPMPVSVSNEEKDASEGGQDDGTYLRRSNTKQG